MVVQSIPLNYIWLCTYDKTHNSSIYIGSVRTYLIAHNFNRMTLDKTMCEHSRSIKGLQKAFPVTEGDGRDGTAKCIAHGKLKMPSTVMCFLLDCFQCIFMYSFIITI